MATDPGKQPSAAAQGRLTSLTFEGFRGFNEATTLDLDASAVLLHGPNGTGKTSVFDGVQWLLTGELPRLTPLRLRRTDRYLRNTFMSSKLARVTGTFRQDGQVFTAHRLGDGRSSSLRVEMGGAEFEGESAQKVLGDALARGSVPLHELLHTSGLLQQDDMRQLLHTKPDARYRQLMRLLGLEVVDAFDQYMQSQKSASRESLRQAEARLAQARSEAARLTEALETALIQVDRATSTGSNLQLDALRSQTANHLVAETPQDDAAVEDLATELSLAGDTLNTCTQLLRALPEQDPVVDETAQEGLEADLARAQQELAVARHQEELAMQTLSEAQAANDLLARLAGAALPLLEGHEGMAPCPVCETEIDTQAVHRSLKDRSTGSAGLAAAQASVDNSRRIRADLEVVAQRVSASLDQVRELRMVARQNESQRESFLGNLRRLTSLEHVRLPRLEEIRTRVGEEPTTGSGGGLQFVRVELAEELATLAGIVAQWSSSLSTWLQQQSIRRLAAERSAAIPRQRAAVADADERVAEMESLLEAARMQELRSASMARSTTSAAGEIFRERFAALEPLMNDVYARLDPHPAFTHLSFEVESYRSKGTATASVRDEELGVTVNPMLIFSAAQANIVVLSAFLALAWAGGRGSLPFMFLDDPLQALDDVNVLGFSDLARHIRRERQLVLATHEARFASLLTRKLTGSRSGEDLIVHEFVGWSRTGPEIVTRRIDSEERSRGRIIVA